MATPPDVPTAAPPPAPPRSPAQTPGRPNPWLLLVAGLIGGLILGAGGGYLLFHGSGTDVAPTTHPSASPSATVGAPATSATASIPSASASAAVQGVVPCPIAAPADQHALGSPAPPSGGRSANASLDFCGGGNATIPTGTTRFTTHNNWEVGIADSCPQGTSGEGGMGTVLTITEVLPDGSMGPDSVMEPGDFVDSGGAAMATGGNYQLQVSVVAPGCLWHIAVYTS